MVSEKVAALRKNLSSRRTRPTVSASQKLAQRSPARTMWWWFSLVVVTASGGFIPPAIALAYAVTEGWNGAGQFVILVFSGLFQGLALGVGEVIALRRGPVRVPVWRWILVTTLAMGLTWLVALLPGTFVKLDWSNPAVLVGMIVVVLLVVLIVPIAQWRILRSRVHDAWRWLLIMGVATALGVGALLSGILLAAGKTTFVSTLLPFILTGWLGVVLFTVISGLGVYWIAGETYTGAETAAILARQVANESRATKATKAAAARVGKRVGATASPVIKKATSKVASAAKKAGSKTVAAAKKTSTSVRSRTAAASARAKSRAKKSSGKKST